MGKKSLALILVVCLSWMSPAYSINSFWLNLKSKLVKFLDKEIDPNLYQYKIIGPAREMKNFLGNRADTEVKFDRLNLQAPSSRKVLIATAYNNNGEKIESIPITLDVKVYHSVYKLNKTVSRGSEILPDNVYKERIAIPAIDVRMYYNGIISQKVATIDIKPGQAIRKNMLRHEKIIQIGDMIKVTNNNPVIQLELMCKAMSSGDIGDTINIHCEAMQRRNHKAIVLEKGRAKLV